MKQLLFLVILAVLSGCKALAIAGLGTASDSVVPVPLSDTRILFGAAAFVDQPVVRAKFSDNWQREEYALFRRAKSQAEIVYIAATARETSLDYEVGLASMIERWNFNADTDIAWGEEIKALATFGQVFVLPYRQRGNSCFGFSAEWAVAIDDPDTQPTKAVFGYYCKASGAALTAERIESLIDAIEVSRFAGGTTTSTPPPGDVTADGGKFGNPGFPFLLARGYTSEGRSFVDRS